VRTATEVAPRTTPPESLKRAKIRLCAGSNGTVPEPCTKIAKVGVALAAIVVVTVGPVIDVHWPVEGLVWHRLMVSGSDAALVSAETVMSAVMPTSTPTFVRSHALLFLGQRSHDNVSILSENVFRTVGSCMARMPLRCHRIRTRAATRVRLSRYHYLSREAPTRAARGHRPGGWASSGLSGQQSVRSARSRLRRIRPPRGHAENARLPQRRGCRWRRSRTVTGVDTAKKVKPIPSGYAAITRYLRVRGAAQALECYKKAFGAKEAVSRMAGADGQIMHAEMKVFQIRAARKWHPGGGAYTGAIRSPSDPF
jgi:hypothetical protein